MLDFDDIEDWAPKLTAALHQHIPNSIEQTFIEAAPEYIEDAQGILFDLTDRDTIIDTVVAWLRSNKIAGYHGTRMTDTEINSVLANGLIPLKAEMRRERLVGALSCHPRWPEVIDHLDAAIQAYGRGNRAGYREGQVHLTLSRAGLTKDFNHYLTYGSEFDQHVAQELLGIDGMELLSSYGEPMVFQVEVPGDSALDAANQFSTIDDFRDRGVVPNIANEFLKSWSYRLAYPSFQSQSLRVDCGMIFYQTIPASWITGFDGLSEACSQNALSAAKKQAQIEKQV